MGVPAQGAEQRTRTWRGPSESTPVAPVARGMRAVAWQLAQTIRPFLRQVSTVHGGYAGPNSGIVSEPSSASGKPGL
jgi:hypothetical protein